MKRLLVLGLFLTGTAAQTAHPHLNKTITTSLHGPVEVSVSYQTASAREIDPDASPVGRFINPWAPILSLSEAVNSGSTNIPSGRYTIGLIKYGPGDWTMALHPGRLRQREVDVTPRLILLDTVFSDSNGSSDHLVIDFSPGTGRFEGKVVLTFHLGTLFLAAELR